MRWVEGVSDLKGGPWKCLMQQVGILQIFLIVDNNSSLPPPPQQVFVNAP